MGFRYRIISIAFGAGLLCVPVAGSRAQTPPPTVHARIVPDSISIGDRFALEVEVEKDLVQVVDFPVYEQGKMSENLEVVQEFPVDTLGRDGRRITLRKRYLMTTFDEGMYGLGHFPVLYMGKNVVDTLFSADSLFLRVTTFDIDTTTQQIYDIKPPMRAPVKFGEFAGYLWAAFWALQVIIGGAYVLMRVLRNREKGQVHAVRKPTEPPHVTAIRELERLNGEKLWQNHRYKLYYTRLTDIVREYIEERFGVNAMEMTTEEIMDALCGRLETERSAAQLRRLLTTADYVKFAKYQPGVEDNEMSYNDAYYFVEDTKFAAPDPDEKPEAESDGTVEGGADA